MSAQKKESPDTPFLWVDLDQMEENIGRMASFCAQHDVKWRPHSKGIKTPAILRKAIEAGAIGVTCAKVSEAEVMAAGGIRDILIANQVVGAHKIQRLAELCRNADVIVAVDDLDNIRDLGAAAKAYGITIRIVVGHIDVGSPRGGVKPGPPVVELAAVIHRTTRLELEGLLGWEGHTQAIPDPIEKEQAIRRAIEKLAQSAEMCRAAGLPVNIVTCGGTATYLFTGQCPGITEVQAGGGILGDMLYRQEGVDLSPAAFVQTMVTSRTAPCGAVIDAGFKAIGTTSFMPEVVHRPDLEVVALHAEQGLLRVEEGGQPLKPGDRLDLVVPVLDRTVFLHDYIYGVRGGAVETGWQIVGRGKLQ